VLDGVRLLHPATIDAAIEEQSCGPDAVVPGQSRFGLGFILPLPEHFHDAGIGLQPFGPNPRAFGHWGSGGSVGFADLDGRVGFGYVMNQYKTGTLLWLNKSGHRDKRGKIGRGGVD
jgi:CubicO group peptidase (beta-lactamase class C family)